jgi:hypothetical protein
MQRSHTPVDGATNLRLLPFVHDSWSDFESLDKNRRGALMWNAIRTASSPVSGRVVAEDRVIG